MCIRDSLKTGSDLFEESGVPPVVGVCEGRYVFEPGTTQTVGQAVEARCPPDIVGNS